MGVARATTDRIDWWLALSGGAFLACSWTWVIGMYLPVILVREFGVWGWVAFAVPNVLGAMAMGVTLRGAGASAARLATNRSGATLFSAVTMAFHAFFLSLLSMRVLAPYFGPLALPALSVVVFAIAWGISRASWRAWRIGAVAVWFISVAMGALAWFTTSGRMGLPEEAGASPFVDLLWLAPVMVFGFALCPYLDMTFHRARREAPGATGTASFVIGFGVLFLAMITLTLLYTPMWLGRAISFYIAGHIATQCAFTVGAHLRELRLREGATLATHSSITLTALLAGALLGVVASLATTEGRGLVSGETVYKCFMGAYGLLFPTLVWTWSAGGRVWDAPARASALGAVVLASPLFWLGFVEQRWAWLAPGLLIALLSPLVCRGLRNAGFGARRSVVGRASNL